MIKQRIKSLFENFYIKKTVSSDGDDDELFLVKRLTNEILSRDISNWDYYQRFTPSQTLVTPAARFKHVQNEIFDFIEWFLL